MGPEFVLIWTYLSQFVIPLTEFVNYFKMLFLELKFTIVRSHRVSTSHQVSESDQGKLFLGR